MSNLPVDSADLADFEQRLGVRLPDYYKATLLDARLRAALCERRVGFLRPGVSMHQFGSLTEALRERHPEFPRDGVLLFCPVDPRTGEYGPDFGYSRFLVPDRKDPTRLGDTVYSWDPQRRRKVRDCTIQQWIASSLSRASDAALAAAGIDRPDPWGDDKPLRVRACAPALMEVLALRGDEAIARLARIGDDWLDCATFPLSGKRLAVCDMAQQPFMEEGIGLAPGKYSAHVRLARSSLGDWPIVVALRLLPPEANVTGRRHAHDVSVDLAAIAVHDRQSLSKKLRTWDRDPLFEQLVDEAKPPCVVELRRGLEALVVPSGDGDGVYPVFVLLDGEAAVGIEVDFNATA
jgi:hypothetical protein